MSLFKHAATLRPPLLALAVLAVSAITAAAIAAATGASWPMGGQNIADTRAAPSSRINADNAKNLALKWKFTTHGDVSATPAVGDGAVYFPDWGGYFTKLDADTGSLIWSHRVSEYDGIPGAVARTSPALVGDTVYIGDQNGAHLIAVDAATGAAKWSTQINNTNFASIITQSPVVFDGVVYVGAASLEEGIAAFVPGYPCCSFRGSFSAVNASTGQVVWTRYMTVPGYSGAGVWSSTPAIDPETRTVYISTGNNYSVPDEVKACQEAGGTAQQCLDPQNHIDAVLALSMDTGAIKWKTGVQGFDDWNVGCIPGLPNPNACPTDPGPDFDFGSGPNLFTIGHGGDRRKVVGAGQKSGQYWLLDAATGQIIWSSAPGPGSTLGGIEWGTATDGRRIYVTETNYFRIPYQLPGGETITSGSFAAIDADTGAVVWQIADPGAGADPDHAHPLGPTTIANGVVYVGSMTGYMYAIDAKNGNVLWQYKGEGASNAGPAIVDGTVYWGNGYNHLGIPEGSESHAFYAFSLNGK